MNWFWITCTNLYNSFCTLTLTFVFGIAPQIQHWHFRISLVAGTSATFSFSLPDLITNDGWREVLSEELEKDYVKELEKKLTQHYQGGDSVYPPTDLIFNALNMTPLDKVIKTIWTYIRGSIKKIWRLLPKLCYLINVILSLNSVDII